MSPPVISFTVLPDDRGALVQFLRAWVRPFDASRERTVAGWLRIAFFSSILFNHTVQVRFEFLDGRMWVVWAQLLRDFGMVGFFLIAGVSLKGKMLANPRVKMPSNLVKLTVAAVGLAAFDILFTLAKGGEPQSLKHHFYAAIYETNLWFFVAYAFAGPLLLSMDGRGVFGTWVCCLLFIMFPPDTRMLSHYILHTISLAFVCMTIGMRLYGKQVNPAAMLAIAALTYVARTWMDDYGLPVFPAIDIILRIVYGVVCFLMLKWAADRLCRYAMPPGWSSYLFVPYLVQFPLISVVTVIVTMLYTGSIHVKMPPVFFSFGASIGFMLVVFAITMAASFGIAWFLRRFGIRV